MCEACVKEEYPNRGNLCLDSGTYLANLKECVGCTRKDTLSIVNRIHSEDNRNIENITYAHKCSECGHVICLHEYKFWIEDNFQHYEMQCLLCGEADDIRSCHPEDPRQNNFS